MSSSISSTTALTRIIQDREVLRASIQSLEFLDADASGITFRTSAKREKRRSISSADLVDVNQKLAGIPGEIVTGCLRIDAISDFVFRIRYAEGNSVPENRTPMVVGTPTPPTVCKVDPQGDTFTFCTAAVVATVCKRTGHIDIRRPDGRKICGVGGTEQNNFRAWDSQNTGISRTTQDGAPIAVESFELAPGECIYGLGEKFMGLDKVGQTIELDMNDALGVISPRSYKNVPFYVSTHGYGVYFNHHSLMTYWVGSLSAVNVQVAIADDYLDYYVIVGDLKEVLGRYTEITGKSPMLPEWSFGLWQSKSTYVSAAETLEIARQLRAHEIPCDVLNVDTAWFEKDWMCGLEFGSAFPDPAGWIREMGALGFKISLWQTPYLPEGTRLFSEIAAAGGFVKNRDGGIYNIGICFTPGFKGVVGVIDFTNPSAVEIYQKYLRRLFQIGVRVIKTDFGEQAPVDGVYHNGMPGTHMHNLYPLLYNTAVTEAIKAEKVEAMVWSRSVWAGSQRMPVHWGGDSSPLWSNLIPQIAGGLSFGLSGFVFWSHDIGGFFGEKTDEQLFIRWLQAGVFCSHPRIHGMGIQELYKFSPETLRIGQEFIRLRYRLLPYVLAQARLATTTALPLMRPLVVEFQDDPNVWRICDQFMFGDSLMVAPIYDATGRRRVYLPTGEWTDWWTRKTIPGGRWIEVEHSLETIPLYIREGANIPLGPVMNYVGESDHATR